MSDANTSTAAEEHTVGPHESADDHGGDHGHDDHAHDSGDALGAMDPRAWGAGAVGIVAGLIVALALAASAGWFG